MKIKESFGMSALKGGNPVSLTGNPNWYRIVLYFQRDFALNFATVHTKSGYGLMLVICRTGKAERPDAAWLLHREDALEEAVPPAAGKEARESIKGEVGEAGDSSGSAR